MQCPKDVVAETVMSQQNDCTVAPVTLLNQGMFNVSVHVHEKGIYFKVLCSQDAGFHQMCTSLKFYDG